MHSRYLKILSLGVMLTTSLHGQVVVSYTFGTAGNETYDADFVAAGVLAGTLTAGPGLDTFLNTHAHSTGTGHVDAPHLYVADPGFANSNPPNDLSSGVYISFVVTPEPGTKLDFESLEFDAAAASNAGQRYFWAYSSVDGFEDLGDELGEARIEASSFNVPEGTLGHYSMSLANDDFQGITDSIEWRLYYSPNWSGGSVIDNITLRGSVLSAVPEPETMTLLTALLCTTGIWFRRRREKAYTPTA